MANEEEITALVKSINENLQALNDKPTINMTTLATSLLGTLIVGAFLFYIGMVKFTSDITHEVNDNTTDVEWLKNHVATKDMINSHSEQENYNFRQVGKKLEVEFIFHKPIK